MMGCNGGTKTPEVAKEEKPAQSNLSNDVQLHANDSMKYDKIEIHVKANEKIRLTLTNIGTKPKEVMGHNFVLLKEGTDLASFAGQAVSAAPDYIPANNPAIIAHTKLLGAGESDTIEFTVPPGEYTYICSFPGHYLSMTGILTAE